MGNVDVGLVLEVSKVTGVTTDPWTWRAVGTDGIAASALESQNCLQLIHRHGISVEELAAEGGWDTRAQHSERERKEQEKRLAARGAERKQREERAIRKKEANQERIQREEERKARQQQEQRERCRQIEIGLPQDA